ncbi:putative rhomboid protein [Tupanvirus soda lake]|uniref:Rhomboid protein n=2 Tax=Tupanvirus TaxID=2094720 RepID=A0AC62ABD8_9VIRU|nr:putative rhomboid protein [Tupanvirus soda lake]QKU34983.1 putative rhomboid protein [Tupanvirus soda lake]
MRVITYIILGIIVLIFFSSFNFYDTGYDIVDYPLRSLYHANVSHLVANGISLFALSFMEEIIGWNQFLLAILFIWIVSSILLYIIHIIFPSRKIYTVGFSAVIFGLVVIYYSLLNQSTTVTLAGLVISILPQLVVPGISFEGHLAGIISGIIYVLLFPVKRKDIS